MLGVGGFVGVIEGEVGRLHAFFEVAGFAADAGDEVLLRLVGDRDGNVGFGLVVDDGRAVGHGFVDGEDGREQLVLDLDLGEGGLGLLLGLGGDGGDAVADEADLGVEHEGVVGGGLGEALARGAVGDARDVAVPQDRLDAGHLFGGGDVHGDDLRVRMRAPQHLDDQGVAGREVGDVGRLAEGELHGVDLADGMVDLLEVFGLFEAHGILLRGGLTWPCRRLRGGRGHGGGRPRSSRSRCSGRGCRPCIRGRCRRDRCPRPSSRLRRS